MSIREQIEQLKKKKNAVILAHYYVSDEVQALADYIGDSYYLSELAVHLEAETIVFCGVSFMGESAKLLNPKKTVLMPDMAADCAMAHMASPEAIRQVRATYEDVAVVCYINSTAELKSLSDVCVTSANAVKIVQNLPQQNIYFIPDRNLAHHVAAQVPEKHFVFNEGWCPIHESISLQEVQALQQAHPEAELLIHPECPTALLKMAHYIGSTSGIIGYVAKSDKREFIICTEVGVRYALQTENPSKHFYFPATTPTCHDMKLITPEKILHVLQTGENQVQLPALLQDDAVRPLEQMLTLAKQRRR